MKLYRDCEGLGTLSTISYPLSVWFHPTVTQITLNWVSNTDISPACNSINSGNPPIYEKGLEKLLKMVLRKNKFHSKLVDKDIFATGGRVLNIVNVSNNFAESKKQALTILKDINWTKGFYRKDIGYKVIS